MASIEQEKGKIVMLFYDSDDEGRHILITDAVADRLAKAGYKVYKGLDTIEELALKYQNGYITPLRYDTRIAVFCLGFSSNRAGLNSIQDDVIKRIGEKAALINEYGIDRKDIIVIRVTDDYQGWADKVHENGMRTMSVRVDENMHSAMAAAKIFDKLSHTIGK